MKKSGQRLLSFESSLWLLNFLDLEIVKRGNTRRSEQTNSKKPFARLPRNRQRLAFLVPIACADERSDEQVLKLPALFVVHRGHNVRALIGMFAANDVLRPYPPRHFQASYPAAVDGKSLHQ